MWSRFRFPGASARPLPDGVRAGRRTIPAAERAAYVRRMFGAIAPRYDLTNTVISAGLHGRWKRLTVAALELRPGERALDICCGTGDLARMMAETVGSAGSVVGVDFALPMIVQAHRLAADRGGSPAPSARPSFLAADALRLPFAAAAFDAAAVAFGLRNVADPAAALREIRRVLRPGGRLAVLEFGRVPNPVVRTLYDLYSFTLLAALGRLVSGHPDAYWYLPVSIRHWLDQKAMIHLLGETGFDHATYHNLAQGVVAIYRAEVGGARAP
jgi:demethylmenaquinone methyltransferase/2-methoxy-6-polyprenyl-1,4-benzoquinol methylase